MVISPCIGAETATSPRQPKLLGYVHLNPESQGWFQTKVQALWDPSEVIGDVGLEIEPSKKLQIEERV
jgi:hypothetical protein